MRLELLHIKQCVSKHRKEVHNGANPLHSPSLKNKKGHLQLRPVGALPDISPHRKHQVKRNACVNGLNHCLRQQRLNYKHIFSGCVKQYQKIFSAISTFWHIRGTPQAFKHQQRNPAEGFYAFKRFLLANCCVLRTCCILLRFWFKLRHSLLSSCLC